MRKLALALRRVGIAAAAAVMGFLSPASAQIDAAESFLSRQQDLIELAGRLGTLHRFQQLCGYYNFDRYRERMQELVPLESPMGRTRLDMIEAFNSNYRQTSRTYLTCSTQTQGDFQREARRAMAVVNKLYAPFRQ